MLVLIFSRVQVKLNVSRNMHHPFIETRTKASEDEFFTLDSHKMNEEDLIQLIERTQTANIFAFIGHVCEFRHYLSIAYKHSQWCLVVCVLSYFEF